MKVLPHENTKALLSWTAPEYIKHSKGVVWFLLAGIVALVCVGYAVYTASWTMAIAFIALAGVYVISHHREPTEITVSVNDFGLQVGTRSIPYNQIKAFWVVYHPPHIKVLKLLTSDKFMAELSIQLDGQEPGELRQVLLKHIPEYEGKSESFVELLIRAFKL